MKDWRGGAENGMWESESSREIVTEVPLPQAGI